MDREEFEKLTLEEQERIFHHAPFKERAELLFYSHNPAHLTQSLSQEELYLVTQEMDLEERSEVLRYATLPQLFFISDIDCWKKDRLHSKNFVHWLETLLEADPERLLAWLVEMDYETVVSGFRKLIRVLKPEWEYPSDELLGDQPFFTLDERYFISVQEENLEMVRRAIEVLYENHRGRYVAILEGILGELDYELEEEAYQKRSIRLAERGFPDPETAHHIYRPLTRGEFEKFPRKDGFRKELQDNPELTRAASYLMLWSQDRFFLDEVLLLFRGREPEVQQGIEEEFAWLSNKVMASEGIDFASEERVRRSIERARRMVNIGLEVLSGRNHEKALKMMEERWLEILFRYGVTELVKLRDSAHEVLETYWKGARKPFLEFLDAPYGSIFKGLFFKPVPQCFDPEVRDSIDNLRDFKDLQDVERTKQSVFQIDQIHGHLRRHFPTLFHRLNLRALWNGNETRLFSLLSRQFTSFVLDGKSSLEPLSPKQLAAFLKKGFRDQAPHRHLVGEWKAKFLNHFFSIEDQELLCPLWGLVFQSLEEELGRLNPASPIDRRFVDMGVRR